MGAFKPGHPSAGVMANIALLLAALIWIVPFIQPWHLRPLMHFYSEWLSGAIALFACGLLLVNHQPRLMMPVVWLLALIGLVLVHSLWLRPVYLTSSFGPIVYLTGFGMVMLAGIRLRQIFGLEKVIRILAIGMFIGGLLQAISGLIQLYGGPDWLSFWARPFNNGQGIMGNARQQNHFADHVMLGLVAGCYLVLHRLVAWRLFLASAPVLLVALALSGSRSVILYFCVLMLSGAIWYGLARKSALIVHHHVMRHALLMLLALFVTFLCLQWLLPYLHQSLGVQARLTIDRVAELSNGASGLGVRLDLWHKAWLIFKAYPLGSGPDSFAWHVWDMDQPGTMGYTMHSHNLLTEVAVSLGIPGLILLGGFMLSVWRQLTVEQSTHLWLVVAALTIVGTHAMLELPLWNLHFLLPTGLMIGVGIRVLPESNPVLTTWYLRGVMWVLLVFSAWLLWHTAYGYRDLSSFWLEKQSFPQTIQRFVRASNNIMLAPIAESSIADLQPLNRDKVNDKVLLYSKVIRYRPYPRAVFRQGLLLALKGNESESLATIQRAMRLYPEAWHGFSKSLCMQQSREAAHMIKEWQIRGAFDDPLPQCLE